MLDLRHLMVKAMLKIKEAIVVEGRYDKNKLSQIVDTLIIETSGFGIFNNSEKRALLKKICDEKGIIILTDSDGAGFVIRNHLKGALPNDKVKNAYIPQIEGKERRKPKASKEGFLGVEGVNVSVIIEAIKKAGATILEDDSIDEKHPEISKTDFYEDGLSGGENSAQLRLCILKECGLPCHMTANAMLEAFNVLYTRDEYKALVEKVKRTCNFK